MTVRDKNAVDQALANSLKELGRQQPIEKITIKEIAEGAGVIRPTFYHHFQDKFELIEWIIKTELLMPMMPLLRNGMIEAAMVLLFSNIEHEKCFYTRLARMEGPVSFFDIANHCVREVLLELLKEISTGKPPKHQWLTPEIVSAYYAQSMCFTCIEWIHMGMTIPPNEMAEAYQYIISSSMNDVIREL